MIEIKEKKECCGCYGCENICPKNSIKMVDDKEGFWYPKVDKETCIECGLCIKVCPVKSKEVGSEKITTKYYACKNKKVDNRLSSSSGGVFNIMYDYVIAQEGSVFGVSFDEEFNLRHIKANDIKSCEEFRGSKYLQSRVGNTYTEVKKDLAKGKMVLFSGTQCQIKGLNLFLRKKYENLSTIEIICHGVPSPEVHKRYLEIKGKEYKSSIKIVNFRDKVLGWKKFSYSLEFENGQKYSEDLGSNTFMQGFLKDLYLRPSCYDCKSKNFKSGADISLADYWGVQNIHPEFDDDKGTSLVLVNTEKGQEIINLISDKMDFVETDGEFAVSNNPCIVRPIKYNPKREKFFEDFDKVDLIENIKKNIRGSLVVNIKGKLYRVLIRIKQLWKRGLND